MDCVPIAYGMRTQRVWYAYPLRMIYVRPISYRCYVSTFRTMCDTFSDIIPVEIEEKLKELNIYQFLQFSGFEQNAPLIYQLLTMWNIEKQSFIIEGHVVPFTADEVALLTGLPNRGEEITWMTLPSSTISSKDIKTELFELTRESSSYTMFDSWSTLPFISQSILKEGPVSFDGLMIFGMTIFSSGNVMVSRRMIDEILSESYLDNDHVDAFAIILNEKSKISPDEYQKYLYISPMYWHYKVKDVKSVLFLEHIDYNSVQSSSIIINPIIDGEHWTLLVGYIKQKRWEFYDSISNSMHRSIAVKIIASLNKDYKKAFRQNITKWSFKTMKKAPTQTNNTDCGMFVCKYMENIVRQNNSNWIKRTDWQEKMPKYRAEFAYGLFCAAMK
ncbi:hypothetical protein KFK09_003922 [Dendrobium nobile]|uniref:Ubiquitin-like protease family profile domain-containing protein n=1 Tax=Dendrobium nobile TaxID=94219 RepID=A0A8T3C4T8_DENNO|nr:hypothetical protein KFK09_003922 [Dendrobium nobile]